MQTRLRKTCTTGKKLFPQGLAALKQKWGLFFEFLVPCLLQWNILTNPKYQFPHTLHKHKNRHGLHRLLLHASCSYISQAYQRVHSIVLRHGPQLRGKTMKQITEHKAKLRAGRRRRGKKEKCWKVFLSSPLTWGNGSADASSTFSGFKSQCTIFLKCKFLKATSIYKKGNNISRTIQGDQKHQKPQMLTNTVTCTNTVSKNKPTYTVQGTLIFNPCVLSFWMLTLLACIFRWP